MHGLFFSKRSRNKSWNRGRVYCYHSQVLFLTQTKLLSENLFTLFSLYSMFLGLLLRLPHLLVLLSDCRNHLFTWVISQLPVCDLCFHGGFLFQLLHPTRQFCLHLKFSWYEGLLSCNKFSAITGLQAQILFGVVFTWKRQGLLICVGGEFELLICLPWQKHSF